MAKTRFALTLWLCLLLFPAYGASAPSTAKKPARPAWTELTPGQQQILAPLASDWDQLDTIRRKKWVAIANRYPKMKPPEQQRLQQRMTDWAKLTPEERRAARERYQTLKKLPPDQRQRVRRQWTEYQQSRAAPAEAEQPAATSESGPPAN